MKLGEVVQPIDGRGLHSGAESYNCAVCIQESPKVIVSLAGDMRWESTIQNRDFETLYRAPSHIFDRCLKRLKD